MNADTPRGKGWPRTAKPKAAERHSGGPPGRGPEPALEAHDPALEAALREFLAARYGPGSMSKAVIDGHIRPALRIAIDAYARAKKRPRTE